MAFKLASCRNHSSTSLLLTDFQDTGLVCVGADTTSECGSEDKLVGLQCQLFGTTEPGAVTCSHWELEVNGAVTTVFKKGNKE